MNNLEKLVIKPHHFLDIIKLYGAGVAHFTPDLRYGHDFYRAANKILENPNVLIALTTGADDICYPCRFNKNGHCVDSMPEGSQVLSKDEWNRTIDARLLNALSLNEIDETEAIAFAAIAQEKLTSRVISEVWRERPRDETGKRIASLQKGLRKYLEKHFPSCQQL